MPVAGTDHTGGEGFEGLPGGIIGTVIDLYGEGANDRAGSAGLVGVAFIGQQRDQRHDA